MKHHLGGAVCLAIIVAGAYSPAAVSSGRTNGGLRQTVVYWFGRIAQDYHSANACHGCPSGAANVQADGLQCMKT